MVTTDGNIYCLMAIHSSTGNVSLDAILVIYNLKCLIGTSWRCWSISHCSVSCHRTLLMTVNSSRTPVGARFDRRILRCSLFDAPTVHLVIGVSLSLELGSGTVSRPLCAQPTCPLNGSNGHWRRFCLFETASRLWLFCLKRAGYKFSDRHTYI